MNLLFKGLKWYTGNKLVEGDMRISKGLISAIEGNITPQKKDYVVTFNNQFVYPGLINSHDHLEMNLYPRMGTPPYQNYIEWSNDVFKPNESPVSDIESVPIGDRLLFGGLKNLISGVTTVVHHNPWKAILGNSDFPVKVLKDYRWNHSLAFGKKSDKPQGKLPFIIHVAEGIDDTAGAELKILKAREMLTENSVLVHCIQLDENDLVLVDKCKPSIIWCPASNIFMFNKTANIQKLKSITKVALGSDSTMTGSPTLLQEMHVANSTNLATQQEVYEMVTSIPASIFKLGSGIEIGTSADLFVSPIFNNDYFTNLSNLQPAQISMVVNSGEPKLMSIEMHDKIFGSGDKITINKSEKWTSLNTQFLNRIEKKVKSNILDKNPLWKMIS